MAVTNWNGGAVNNFNQIGDGAWTYTVASTPTGCATAGRGTLQKSTQGETARDPQALGAEIGESDFTGYMPLVYTDANPPSLGQVAQQAEQCQLTYDLFFQGSSVR